MTVLVVGDVVTDVLAVLRAPLAIGSDTPAGIRLTAGGAAGNTAAWLAFAGTPVTLLAVVGTDPAGDLRLAELERSGVRPAVRRTADAPTGTVVVLAESAERSMLSDRGANLLLQPSDVDAVLAGNPGYRHLHLSGYTLLDEASRPAGRHALAAARAAGMTTSVDAASAEPLRQNADFLDWVRDVDILFANLEEARVLGCPHSEREAVDLAVALAAAGPAAVVVKSGADGAVWAGSGVVVAVPAEPTATIDPTGAGDAFAAGLLSAWLSGADPEAALRAGAGLGAHAVRAVGTRPPATSP